MINLKKSQFFKSICQLTMGSLVAQLITILCSPVLTRIYSVEDMGMYALLLSIVSIFGSVLNGKYDYAIVSTEKEVDIDKLVIASFIFSLYSLILVFIGLTIYVFFDKKLWDEVGFWIYLIILLLFTIGVLNIITAYNNRMKEYKIISKFSVIRSITQNGLLILNGFFLFGSVGMIFSQIIGNLVGIKEQSSSLKKNRIFSNRIKLKEIVDILKKYKNFPLYSLPANLINNISYSMLNFFITGLYGVSALGFYSMSYRILGLPLSLVSVNVSRVFFKDASEEYKRNRRYRKSLVKSTLLLSSIAFPMFLVLFFFAPLLFGVFFGEKWIISGEYVKILALMFSIRLVVSGLTPAFIICNRQRLELFFQSLFLISSALVYIVGKFYGISISSFLKIYSILNVGIYIFMYMVIFLLSKGGKK